MGPDLCEWYSLSVPTHMESSCWGFFFFLLHSRSFKAQSIKKVGSQEDLKVFRDDSDWNIVWEARTMYKEEKTGKGKEIQ